MRKLVLQMQVSADGYVAGLNGELDWMTWNWDDELKNVVSTITANIDCIILGRKLAQGFIPHWAARCENPENPDYSFARIMHDTPKIVFSRTIEHSDWDNTTIEQGDLAEVVSRMKQQDGKDIMVYGGSGFVSALVKEGLIDEYNLFVNPAAIGNGMQIFNTLDQKLPLKLVKATQFDCGIAQLQYQPNRG